MSLDLWLWLPDDLANDIKLGTLQSSTSKKQTLTVTQQPAMYCATMSLHTAKAESSGGPLAAQASMPLIAVSEASSLCAAKCEPPTWLRLIRALLIGARRHLPTRGRGGVIPAGIGSRDGGGALAPGRGALE